MKKLLLFITIFIIMLGCNGCTNQESIQSDIDSTSKAQAKVNNYTVCLDAGHGFDDPGCESVFLDGTEADINLKIMNSLKQELTNYGITVIITHNGNRFPSCQEITTKAEKYGILYDASRIIENNIFSAYERVIYANTVNIDKPINLFLSLHINSLENDSKVNRYELYYYKDNPFSEELLSLCTSLSEAFDATSEITATNADISYTVTRYTDFPSLLLECGYATNRSQAEKLNSQAWRTDFCKSLSKIIYLWLQSEFI